MCLHACYFEQVILLVVSLMWWYTNIITLKRCYGNGICYKHLHLLASSRCGTGLQLILLFVYVCISKQLLLLSGDIETNPGPVTRLCPQCSAPVHIKVLVCQCGHVFSKKGRPLAPSKLTTQEIKTIDIRNKQAKRRASETNAEALLRREKNRVSTARKRSLETDIETVLRKEKDRMSTAKKRALETDTETVTVLRKEKDRMSTAKKRALETDTETVLRNEKNKVSTAKKRALETDTETSLRKQKG